jgi:hypothetical protein
MWTVVSAPRVPAAARWSVKLSVWPATIVAGVAVAGVVEASGGRKVMVSVPVSLARLASFWPRGCSMTAMIV